MNGRITRLFCGLIAVCNGYGPIDYSAALADSPQGRNGYIEASIACVQEADNGPLYRIILSGLRRH